MARRAVAALAALLSFGQALGGRLLPPPRNVTLMSKDFSLFLTWQPGAGYPPGVFYTVQWTNVYNTWRDFHPCRNVSETVCNVTCASPDVHHSFGVRVKAQGGAGAISSAWVNVENIDYEVNVTLGPPALQVRKTGDTVVVNASSSTPSCLQDIFSDLTSELEFWEAGTNNRKKISMKNAKVFDATVFSGRDYCFSARTALNDEHSDFSEPICLQLHSKVDTWAFAAVPVLLLLILLVCILLSLYRSRSRPKTVRIPQALNFSGFKCPKVVLEFTEKEFAGVSTCPGHPVAAGNRSRLIPQIPSQLVPSVLEEYEEEEEEDIGSSRPYTEVHRFPKTDIHSQRVGLGEKEPEPCSESDSSQLSEGSMPDLTMPGGFFVLTKSVLGEMASAFQESETTSLSAGFSLEDSSVCPDSYPIAQREGQEDLDEATDFLLQLSGSSLSTGKLLMPSGNFCEANGGILGDPQISLFGVQSSQDFCGLLLEDEKLYENESCDCGRPMGELSPLKVPSREDVGSNTLGRKRKLVEDSSPGLKSCGYQPRPMLYLPRILQR